MSRKTPGTPTGRRGGGPIKSALLGLTLAAAYLANGRELGTNDTEAALMLVRTLMRGEIVLDRFEPILREAGEPNSWTILSRGHYVSQYPVAPALLALPIVAVESAYLDRRLPSWDLNVHFEWHHTRQMSKHAAAILTALAGVALYRLFHQIGLGRVALVATLIASLGSTLWTTASQALWQHGPAALMLTTALLLLAVPDPKPWRFVPAGVAVGLLAAIRSIDVIFAVPIVAWVALRHPRRLPWFLPGLLLVVGLLLAYNLHYFGELTGGQFLREHSHPQRHGVAGPWSSNLLEGAAGTLISPSRGLFLYSPWVLLALALAPASAGRLRTVPLIPWVLGSLPAFFLLLSSYAVWWAGHSYGPRYWTEAIPLFAILLAAGLDWIATHARWLWLVVVPAALWSIAVQVLGAWYDASSWNLVPANVDLHHDRLWDWTDSQILRILKENDLLPWNSTH